MAPTLGYWNIRGLATPIRLLLEYAGEKYEEKLYEVGPPPDFERKAWMDDKFNLGMDFPNLPYYIDGDVKLSQSHVILRHLGRKHNLVGKTEADQCRVDLIASQIYDYHMEYCKIVYVPQFNQLKGDYLMTLPDKFKALSAFLGDRKFVAGDYVTFADFILFEYLEGQHYFNNEIISKFPVLEAFHKRMHALEAVSKYFSSPKAIKYPFNGGPAFFGGPYSDQLQASS